MGHGEENEQPLVDLELLAHFEARDIERTEREVDLDEDTLRARCEDDESFASELAAWEGV